MGAGILVEGLFPVFITVVLAQIIWGAGATFLSGADIAWLNDETEGKNVDGTILKGIQFRNTAIFIAIILSVIIASVQVNYSVILSGISFIIFSVILFFLMPENKFHKEKKNNYNPFREMKNTFSGGVKEIRKSKIILILILVTLITGLYSEGFDRLWSYKFLKELSFPFEENLNPIYWFAVFQSGTVLFNITFVEILKRKISEINIKTMLGIQSVINIFLSGTVFYFAFTGNFYLALASYWIVQSLRNTNSSISNILINKKITNSSVRATVLSMNGQMDQLGQIIGGPVIGFIATSFSLTTALFISSFLIIPAALILMISFKSKMLQTR